MTHPDGPQALLWHFAPGEAVLVPEVRGVRVFTLRRYEGVSAFAERLAYCIRAWRGQPTVLVEAEPPNLARAQARMLERLYLALRLRNLGPGIGDFTPGNVLLVGDRPNGTGWDATRPNWPFISGLRSGCSAWLADQLEAAAVPESALYWINATTVGAAPTDPAFVAMLQPRRVIALGTHAHHWYTRLGRVTERAYHPQYWKRFHATERYHLITLLKRSLA